MKHYYTKYINELIAFDGTINSDMVKLVAMLDYQCVLLESARNRGDGYEVHTNEMKILLEKLAQKADLANTRTRNVLEAFWNDLPDEIPYQPKVRIAYPTLEMSYVEHVPLFTAKLPPFLPYSMSKGANYLRDQVEYNIRRLHDKWYAEHGNVIRITPAAVAFVHCARHGEWRNIRDYDNLERKRVLDALQIGGMFSDNPSRMVELNMMAWAEQPCTDIYITRLENLKNLVEIMDFTAYQTGLESDVDTS